MTNYNKVMVMVNVCGKKMPLYYVAPASLEVLDDVVCETSKGWMPGTIISMREYDVVHTNTHKEIRLANKKKMEDKQMAKKYSNEIFGTVLIEGNKGRMVVCKAVESVNTYEQVVYEGTDGMFHVGMVGNSVGPGEALEVSGLVDVGGFIVDTIVNKWQIVGADKERNYKNIKDKLQLRKKRFEEDAIWQMLAEKDSEAKELLDQLKAMRGDK